MPKKTRSKPRAGKRTSKRQPKRSTRVKSADEEAFTQSLIAHGQAAKVGPDGKLPAGATHELIEDEYGEVKVVRRRFSIV
jgi:hypothetical protein